MSSSQPVIASNYLQLGVAVRCRYWVLGKSCISTPSALLPQLSWLSPEAFVHFSAPPYRLPSARCCACPVAACWMCSVTRCLRAGFQGGSPLNGRYTTPRTVSGCQSATGVPQGVLEIQLPAVPSRSAVYVLSGLSYMFITVVVVRKDYCAKLSTIFRNVSEIPLSLRWLHSFYSWFVSRNEI